MALGLPDPRRQFRVLLRDFLARMVDLELLSSRGDIQRLLGQFAAMLAAFSFTFMASVTGQFVTSRLSRAQLEVRAWKEIEFLVAATMAIAGLFAVLAWNNVFPDRRDSLILGVLPVRARILFLAKTAAIAIALGVSVVAVNCFTGLAIPVMALPATGALGVLRPFLAYWAAMLAAGLFVCCGMLAVQGVAAQFLSYRLFVRVSGFLQLAAFFTVLGVFFLKPSFPEARELAAAQFQPWFRSMPSFWFFGLLQWLSGANDARLTWLAMRALWALAIVATAALVSFALAYSRNIRRIVEQPDIAPSDRSRPAARWGSWLARRWIGQPVERAIVLFTARTLARSRQHRLLIAAYGGVGLAIAMAYSRELIYGAAAWELAPQRSDWRQPNTPLMIVSLVLLVFAVMGARAVFALPLALPANWIFRVTAVHRPSHYFSAVRKSVFLLAAGPICAAAAAGYIAIWPLRPAVEHIAVLSAAALLLVSRSLDGFQKIPFACSYLPGKANINVKLGAYALLFLLFADMGVHLEFWAMHGVVAFGVVFGLLAGAAIWAHRHWKQFAASPDNRIQFEDLPIADVSLLDLHGGGGGDWTGGESPPAEPSVAVLLRTRIEQMLSDLRYGARILTRSPGFSAAAVLLIAMGIGGNTAIYSMIHGILSKPAPGVRSGGLVVFGASINGRADDPGNNSYPSHLAYAYRTRTMQSFAAAKFARFTLGLADGTWQLRGFQVTGSYIGTLGLQLSKGRDFTENEARGAAPLAAIIAWHVWQNQFHGDSTVIGSAITLDGWPATVVGVGPPGFRGLEVAPHFEICVPLEAYFRLAGREEELRNPASRGFTMVGRLKPAATLAQAQAEFDALSKLLEAAFPDANRGRRVLLAAYPSAAFGPLGGPQSRLFETLLLVAGLVTLSIVCANVANLMLTRALARRKEMAVRMALGASWTRVVRILLAEGATLSLAASGAALLLAWWVTSIVGSLMPPIESGARFTMDLTPDWPVALYALALAAFCTLVFSIAPAVHLWRQDLAPRLKGSGEAAARGLSVSSALLVAQLALCAVLAAAGGFAWRALAAIDNTDVLIARDHLLLAAINTTPAGQPATALNSIRGRLLALPEVTSVSWALAAPPDSHSWKGVPATAVGSGRSVRTQGSRVGPDYLHALGVRLLAGRDLSGADLRSPRPMAVINQKLADALWPGQPAVGRTFSMRLGDRPVEVVGVAPNAPFSGVGDDGSYAGMGRAERPNFVFLPDSTEGVGQKTLHIRYRGDGGHLAQSVRAAIHQVDPGLPVFSMRTMEQEWASFTGPMRFISILVRIFALAALLLASVGLYAVVSFRTARRTHEFGIRAALGASPRQAIGEALRGGLRLSFIGLAIGLAIAGVAGRALRSLLFGVAPMDAAVLLTVVGLLGGVSWVACYLPARRAGRVDPAIALRHE